MLSNRTQQGLLPGRHERHDVARDDGSVERLRFTLVPQAEFGQISRQAVRSELIGFCSGDEREISIDTDTS